MSSSTKSKSKDKRPGKEQKTPSKSSTTLNGGGSTGLSASAYNPLLGTFHTLEALSTFSGPTSLHVNGRFKNIDDSDDHSGSTHGSGGDYDSASNNDSRSVESEEHNKERTTTNGPTKQDIIPGADNDKREKIRQKNERKHQRQKERRAQELHERRSGYLMSRKLESLAQQIVAMGISHERATMALILNEGRVEEAVTWLFEVSEEDSKHKDLDTGGNLKIDISEELARISELEIKYKCSKQEVERAVVTSEGDLDKAEENLRSQKQEQAIALSNPEETGDGDPPTFSNGRISVGPSQTSVRLLQPKPNTSNLVPPRRDEKDFNYTKGGVTLTGGLTKPGPKTVQPVTKVQPKLEWARPQEKRWPVVAGSSTSVSSYSLPPPLPVSSPPPTKVESRYPTIGNEYKNLQSGSVQNPIVMMQRPQSLKVKPSPTITNSMSSSPPGTNTGWYPTNSEILKQPNGLLPHIPIPSTRSPSPSPNNLTSNQFYNPTQYQYQNQPIMMGISSWSRLGGSPPLAAASSLGLFSGSTCSSGSNSPVDWNTNGSMSSCDYTNIDWSLDRSFLPSKQNGLWVNGLGQFSRNGSNVYDTGASGMGVNLGMRPPSSNGKNLQDGPGMGDSSGEWTSPFEGKDLFSLPRQFVSSPSL